MTRGCQLENLMICPRASRGWDRSRAAVTSRRRHPHDRVVPRRSFSWRTTTSAPQSQRHRQRRCTPTGRNSVTTTRRPKRWPAMSSLAGMVSVEVAGSATHDAGCRRSRSVHGRGTALAFVRTELEWFARDGEATVGAGVVPLGIATARMPAWLAHRELLACSGPEGGHTQSLPQRP